MIQTLTESCCVPPSGSSTVFSLFTLEPQSTLEVPCPASSPLPVPMLLSSRNQRIPSSQKGHAMQPSFGRYPCGHSSCPVALHCPCSWHPPSRPSRYRHLLLPSLPSHPSTDPLSYSSVCWRRHRATAPACHHRNPPLADLATSLSRERGTRLPHRLQCHAPAAMGRPQLCTLPAPGQALPHE